VIDLNNKDSLQNAKIWLELARRNVMKKLDRDEESDNRQMRPQHFLGVLIGNKTDAEGRMISPKGAQEFATENNLAYFECSAVSTFFSYYYLNK